MNQREHKKLQEVRRSLRYTGLFCFEKGGTFLLYREVIGGRNTKVLTSRTIEEFERRVRHAIGGSGS